MRSDSDAHRSLLLDESETAGSIAVPGDLDRVTWAEIGSGIAVFPDPQPQPASVLEQQAQLCR
jgi:hypothetical protein